MYAKKKEWLDATNLGEWPELKQVWMSPQKTRYQGKYEFSTPKAVLIRMD